MKGLKGPNLVTMAIGLFLFHGLDTLHFLFGFLVPAEVDEDIGPDAGRC